VILPRPSGHQAAPRKAQIANEGRAYGVSDHHPAIDGLDMHVPKPVESNERVTAFCRLADRRHPGYRGT
jgi:hypothetical protein